MIDIDDLIDLRICEICKCVYMPDMEKDRCSDYGESYPRNHKFCLKCEKEDEEEAMK